MNSSALPLSNGDKNVLPRPKWSISDRWAWPHTLPVSGVARAVAGVIAFHADEHTGRSWPGMGTIAEETGFGRTAVIAAIKVLERGGHVKIRRLKVVRDGHLVNISNRYQLPGPMGDADAVRGSAPDGLGGSALDGPEQVRTEQVQQIPPQETPKLPEHLESVGAGHGLQVPALSAQLASCGGTGSLMRYRAAGRAAKTGPDIGQPQVGDNQRGTAGPHTGRKTTGRVCRPRERVKLRTTAGDGAPTSSRRGRGR